MRVIVIIILLWFAVTAVVMPVLAPQEGVDIWTTDDLGEIAAALKSPIDYAVDLADSLGGFLPDEKEQTLSVWDWIFNPLYASSWWLGERVADLIMKGD